MNISTNFTLSEHINSYSTYYEVFNSSPDTTLESCNLILIGETHDILSLMQAQKSIMRAHMVGRSCLLVEGLGIGIEIEKDQLDLYRGMPEGLTIKGSDIRFNHPKEIYIESENIRLQTAEADHQYFKAKENQVQTVAQIMNSCYAESLVYFSKKVFS